MNQVTRIGIIANPVAQSGAGAEAALKVQRELCKYVSCEDIDLMMTASEKHAIELARDSQGRFDLVIGVGGDGVAHEIANGLMQIPRAERPTFAVIPVGSGNDYALTLGMNDNIEKAVSQVISGDARPMDVGCVNGEYFLETLSFGLDAAIAIDTMERRKKTGRRGTVLYMESGFDQLAHHRVPQTFEAVLEGVPDLPGDGVLPLAGQSYIFAVQIGETYGGHFHITPDADPSDGLFDICIARPPLGFWKALGIFMMAKNGNHTGFKCFEFHRAKSLVIDFALDPPCQADGEKMDGRHFVVTNESSALDVICAS